MLSFSFLVYSHNLNQLSTYLNGINIVCTFIMLVYTFIHV